MLIDDIRPTSCLADLKPRRHPSSALHGPPRCPRGRRHLQVLPLHLLLELILQLFRPLFGQEELLLAEAS